MFDALAEDELTAYFDRVALPLTHVRLALWREDASESEGAPAKNHGEIMVSKIMKPNRQSMIVRSSWQGQSNLILRGAPRGSVLGSPSGRSEVRRCHVLRYRRPRFGARQLPYPHSLLHSRERTRCGNVHSTSSGAANVSAPEVAKSAVSAVSKPRTRVDTTTVRGRKCSRFESSAEPGRSDALSGGASIDAETGRLRDRARSDHSCRPMAE
jgi:hypothetical protein